MKTQITIEKVREIERVVKMIEASPDVDLYDNKNFDPDLTEDYFYGYDTERVIFALPKPEVAVMLFRYLGFDSKEITQILEMKNMRSCYNTNAALKKSFLDIKNKENKL